MVDFDPVIFTIYGNLALRWYNLSWMLGILALVFLIRNKVKTDHVVTLEQATDLVIPWFLLGAILGGRTGHMLFYTDISWLWLDPLAWFRFLDGGLSFHGGIIGVIVCTHFFSKNRKLPLLLLTDLLARYAPLGLFSVRVGNFLNGELYGTPTDSMFGLVFASDPLKLTRHPSQLYEAVLEGLLLWFCINYYAKYLEAKRGKVQLEHKKTKQGAKLQVRELTELERKDLGKLSGFFLVFYTIARFSVEFVREPEVANIWVFTVGQLLSIPLLVLGVYLLLTAGSNKLASR